MPPLVYGAQAPAPAPEAAMDELLVQSVQTALSPPVVSNEEVQTFTAVGQIGDRPIYLFSKMVSQQIVAIAGRNLLVTRHVDFTAFRVNVASFAEERQVSPVRCRDFCRRCPAALPDGKSDEKGCREQHAQREHRGGISAGEFGEGHQVVHALGLDGGRAALVMLAGIGLAGGEELLHLRPLDRTLQDHAAGAEVAALVRTHAFLAHIGHRLLEHPCRTFGARAERLQAGEVRDFICSVARLAEIEFRFEFWR